MNKLFITLFAVAAVSFSACGGSAKTEETKEVVEEVATIVEEVAAVDSTLVQEVVDSVVVAVEEVK